MLLDEPINWDSLDISVVLLSTSGRIFVEAEFKAAKKTYDEYGLYRLMLEIDKDGCLIYQRATLFIPLDHKDGFWEKTYRPDLIAAVRLYFIQTAQFENFAAMPGSTRYNKKNNRL